MAGSWLGEARPLADLVAELVRLNPAVIVAEGNPAILALTRATSTVPIVMAVVGDPVGSGFVASLARPGANVSGLSNTAEQLRFPSPEPVELGGLLSYGPSHTELWRQSASYAARIPPSLLLRVDRVIE